VVKKSLLLKFIRHAFGGQALADLSSADLGEGGLGTSKKLKIKS
jgi:hypothetical protein